MRTIMLITVAALVAGCSAPVVHTPTVPNSVVKRVEDRPLPPNPATVALPDGVPKGDWVEPLEKGQCMDRRGVHTPSASLPCPARSGIAISEERAFRDALYRLRYKQLLLTFEADRGVWRAHRALYEERVETATETIRDLQPRWWDRNKFQLGVTGGIVLGIAASVALLSATNRD